MSLELEVVGVLGSLNKLPLKANNERRSVRSRILYRQRVGVIEVHSSKLLF